MTKSNLVIRRTGVLLGAVSIGAAALTGCSNNSPKQELGSPVTTTANPTGANSFAPGITPPAAPTALPGNVITGG